MDYEDFNIKNWIKGIIRGAGGFNGFITKECGHSSATRDEVAAWVIKCLANPRCEGSEDVLKAIIEQRAKVAKEMKR